MLPLVSVIITSYNQKEKLFRAIESVIGQDYPNIEIVIVDDFSTDGSKEFILSLAGKHSNIRYFFQPKNVGITKNKNTGYRLAKGDFITYLDGDDFYYPEKIKKEVEAFHQDPSLDVIYSNYNFTTEDGTKLKTWSTNEAEMPKGNVFDHVVGENYPDEMLGRCELYRREVLYKHNFYDESLSIYEDFDFMLRYSSTAKVGYSHYVGSAYCKNSNSIVGKTKYLRLVEDKMNVYSKNKQLIISFSKNKNIWNKIEKRYNIQLLFLKEKITTGEWFRVFIAYPSDFLNITKALYNYVKKTN